MVEVRRREKESVEGMIRRFTRRLQQSEVISDARDKRFRTKEKSKSKQRESAIKRQQFLAEKNKLVKMGKVKPNHKLPNRYKLKIKERIRD